MRVEKGLLLVPAYPRVSKNEEERNFFKRNIKFLLLKVSLNP